MHNPLALTIDVVNNNFGIELSTNKIINLNMSNKIKAAIRIRPFLPTQLKNGYVNNCISVSKNKKEVQVYDGVTRKSFNFDYILDEKTSQDKIYEECKIDHLIDKSLKGYHATIFAYGQTGSGKTYTMHGEQALEQNQTIHSGIIPKIFKNLFQQIKSNKDRSYSVSLSFLQIYNQKIFDLLNPASALAAKTGMQTGLRLRWNKDEQFSVQNLFIFECQNQEDLMMYFSYGVKNRISAAHKLNLQSSRSHCILTIRIDSFDHFNQGNVLSSKIELVDLAGSERIGLTGTEGKQAKESIDINKSLFTLRQVITILSETTKIKGNQKEKVYVPYRDSKLTSILKQSIGGNSYCLMIACINPNDIFLEQNLSTLTYATKASYITNQPTINDDPRAKIITQLKSQIKGLSQELHKANDHIQMITSMQNHSPNKSDAKTEHILSIKRGGAQKTNQPDQFSQRLVESINMVRQLLKSNKELREKLQLSNQRNDQKDIQIFEMSKQLQFCKQKLASGHPEESVPQINQFVGNNIRNFSSMNRRRHSTNSQRITNNQIHQSTEQQTNLIANTHQRITPNNSMSGFHTSLSKNNFDHSHWNSVEINQYYMNERGVDSVPTNFSRKQVNTSHVRRPINTRNSSVNEKLTGRNAITAKTNTRNWRNVSDNSNNKFKSFYQESDLY